MNQEFDFQPLEDAVDHADSILHASDNFLDDFGGEEVPCSVLADAVGALEAFLLQARVLKERCDALPSEAKEEHLSKIRGLEDKVNDARKQNIRVNMKLKDTQKMLQRTEKRLKMLQRPLHIDETRHEEDVGFLRTMPLSWSECLPPTEECDYEESNTSIDSWPVEPLSLIEPSSTKPQESTVRPTLSEDTGFGLRNLTPSSSENENLDPWYISYVHSGRESAMSGKPESPFVREHEHEGTVTLQIREAAYAQIFKEDVLISSKFTVEAPFKMDKEGAPRFSYIGFRYIDDSTLPFIPVKNVRLLYMRAKTMPYLQELKERPERNRYGHTHIWVEIEKKVFNTIVDMSIKAFREDRKGHESEVLVSGPKVEDYDTGYVRMVVHMNPESYVRVAEEREDVAIGLISSVMYERKSDIVGDATFYLRFASFDDGVPVLCLKLHGIKVRSELYQ